MADSQMTAQAGNMLVPADLLTQSKHANDAVFDGMAAGGYLPRVQLNASSSRLVQKGICKMSTYVLVRGKDSVVKDYAGEFSCLILGWRPKAVKFDDNSAQNFYNPRSSGFQAVEKEADKKPRPRGFLYGPEYLIYLPDTDALALMHFNNPTMRLRAADMKALIGAAATLRVETIEKNSNIWPAPVISGCSTPLALPEAGSEQQKDLFERIKVQQEKFNNPPEEEVEEVQEETNSDAQANEARPR
jgi:hypothetical protein